MSKLSTAISLLLSLVAVLAGCAGPVPEPRASVHRVAEPNGVAPVETQTVAPEPPAKAPPPDTDENQAEPNEPAPAETPELAAKRAPEPVQVIAAEPDPPGTSEPGPPPRTEPNEPVVIEPNEPIEVLSPSDVPEAEEAGPDEMAPFYEGYAEILRQYVRTDGYVNYDGLRRKRLRLRELLNQADELDPNVYRQWTQEGKLAFWIDVYNLKMLDIIARNHPIQSSWWLRLTWPPSDIRHIGGIWSDYRFIVMDEEFTLAAVEQRFLHRTFGDPRAFLAITYASRSGPPLRRLPYREAELDRQLDEQVKAFLTNGRGFRIDRDKGVVYLSALFKPTWRGKEFVPRYGTDKKFKDRPPETRAVLSFITRYLTPDDVYFLEVENYSLEYMNFDWRLNDASP